MILFLAIFAWAAEVASAETVAQAYPPPSGASRVSAEAFGASLGALELRPATDPVKTHDGRLVSHNGHVIVLPMAKGDLQQCADSAIRVRAQWLKDQGKPVSFHATSGDPMSWARWQGGERPYEVDDKLQWRAGTEGGWEAYLSRVFMWAGTHSLQTFDSTPVSEPRAGDILVEGGFPGHAVLLLDVAVRGDETFVLVGEGFMPAQDFHVELGPHAGWWAFTDEGIALPHWPLAKESLRRFK